MIRARICWLRGKKRPTRTQCFRVIDYDYPDPEKDSAVKFPPAHVVDLDAEHETGHDVQGSEKDPEVDICIENSDDACNIINNISNKETSFERRNFTYKND